MKTIEEVLKTVPGHFSVCPLINREVGEIKRITEGGSLSEEDANILYALGVTW